MTNESGDIETDNCKRATVFGTTFADEKGQTFYHFVSEDECYIEIADSRNSEQNEDHSSWASVKMIFDHFQYMKDERIFYGQIVPPQENSDENSEFWVYEMQFSEDFREISSEFSNN